MDTLPDLVEIAFDGAGAAAKGQASGPQGFTWTHLNRDASGTRDWLEASGLDRIVIDALTAEETRPRAAGHGDGVILVLRGVNLNPGAQPEDMISVRLWIDANRVIGVWLRPLMAVKDIIEAADRGQGPKTPGGLVAKLALRLADRAEPVVAALGERIDVLEEAMLDDRAELSRSDIAAIRHDAIVLRRYMLPQRDALSTLEIEDRAWLTEADTARLREAADRVARLGEDLDAVRDRAQIVQDQILDRRSEVMNRNMFVLSIVAAIFLPLGLLTGLLGINVGGIPGTQNPAAFWVVCGLLGVLVLVQIWLFRQLKIL
ncbi:MAG: zinc transporter ZntB [Pseudomonadota bacterium]